MVKLSVGTDAPHDEQSGCCTLARATESGRTDFTFWHGVMHLGSPGPKRKGRSCRDWRVSLGLQASCTVAAGRQVQQHIFWALSNLRLPRTAVDLRISKISLRHHYFASHVVVCPCKYFNHRSVLHARSLVRERICCDFLARRRRLENVREYKKFNTFNLK